jgi:hypothetical protein
MGYRSDGSIVFYATIPENHAAVKLWVDENFPKENFAYEERRSDGRTLMVFSFDGWKWYESYPEIQAANEAMEAFCVLFDSDDVKVQGAMEFIRLGEEVEDIEMRRSNHAEGLLTVNRSIGFFD